MNNIKKTNPCRAQNPETCSYHHPELKNSILLKEPKGNNSTTARQNHGFKYENRIIEKFNLVKLASSIDKFDALTLDNTNVSIKTKKNKNAVEFASWHNHRLVTSDFYLIVGFWEGSTANITTELAMKIPHEWWLTQFPQEYVEKIKEFFTGVSNDKSYDPIWKMRLNAFKKEYSRYKEANNIIINLNPKRDSKKQLRMQCSIPFKEIVNLHNRYGVNEINGYKIK